MRYKHVGKGLPSFVLPVPRGEAVSLNFPYEPRSGDLRSWGFQTGPVGPCAPGGATKPFSLGILPGALCGVGSYSSPSNLAVYGESPKPPLSLHASLPLDEPAGLRGLETIYCFLRRLLCGYSSSMRKGGIAVESSKCETVNVYRKGNWSWWLGIESFVLVPPRAQSLSDEDIPSSRLSDCRGRISHARWEEWHEMEKSRLTIHPINTVDSFT